MHAKRHMLIAASGVMIMVHACMYNSIVKRCSKSDLYCLAATEIQWVCYSTVMCSCTKPVTVPPLPADQSCGVGTSFDFDDWMDLDSVRVTTLVHATTHSKLIADYKPAMQRRWTKAIQFMNYSEVLPEPTGVERLGCWDSRWLTKCSPGRVNGSDCQHSCMIPNL